MDNQSQFQIKQKSTEEELKQERKRTSINCLNLECKNEQLKVLIEKLHKIADQREGLITKMWNEKLYSEEVDKLYLKNLSVEDELKLAKEQSKKLERSISKLKARLTMIDGELAG